MYTPNNACVFLKAYVGALSGLGASGRYVLSPSNDYFARMAFAYAVQFDTTWGVTAPSAVEEDAILEHSSAVWQTHSPLENAVAFDPGSYAGLVDGVIGHVLQGSLQLAAQGVSATSCGYVTPTGLNQPAWWIDRVNGNDANTGADAAHPVQSAAEIRRRWTGNIVGQRPQLPGITITIHWIGPGLPDDQADPISVLLDVDMSGTTLILMGDTTLPAVATGTFATASVFARTSAAGQIQVTDLAVADWNPLVPALVVDTTSGAVAWLYEPKSGAGATGIVTPGYGPQIPGSFFSLTLPITIAPGDEYEIVALTRVTLGGEPQMRTCPRGTFGGSVFMYRLHFDNPEDILVWCLLNMSIFLQECRIDPQVEAAPTSPSSQIYALNCAHTTTYGVAFGAGAFAELINGFTYSQISSRQGAMVFVDGDFTMDGSDYQAWETGMIFIGTASVWGDNLGLVVYSRSEVTVRHINYPEGVFYGRVGSGPVFQINMNAQYAFASVLYDPTGTGTPCQDRFQFNVDTFTLGGAATGRYFDGATGAYSAPIALTFANMDAAQPGGFGGQSQDVVSASIFRITA